MNEVLKKLQEIETFTFVHFGGVSKEIMTEYLDMLEALRKQLKQLEKDLKVIKK